MITRDPNRFDAETAPSTLVVGAPLFCTENFSQRGKKLLTVASAVILPCSLGRCMFVQTVIPGLLFNIAHKSCFVHCDVPSEAKENEGGYSGGCGVDARAMECQTSSLYNCVTTVTILRS